MSTRRGMTFGRRSDRKKAVVTLQKGQKIDFFAGK
jgi:ribosomal protein L23